MLRFSAPRLAVGAYTLFMMEQKNHPSLKGLPVSQRGKQTSKLYKQLTPTERASLEKRAALMPALKRAEKKPTTKAPSTKRPMTAYTLFVKANLGKFTSLPQRDRMKEVAKLWKMQQSKAPAVAKPKVAPVAVAKPKK